MKKEKEARILVILFYMEKGVGQEDLKKINPRTFQEDIKFLERKGLIKDLQLTSEAEKILKNIPFRKKRNIERYFFSSNN